MSNWTDGPWNSQGRNIQVEHIPGHKNKAANCLSQLPFMTSKRNDNPLKDEDVSLQETKVVMQVSAADHGDTGKSFCKGIC